MEGTRRGGENERATREEGLLSLSLFRSPFLSVLVPPRPPCLGLVAAHEGREIKKRKKGGDGIKRGKKDDGLEEEKESVREGKAWRSKREGDS